MTRDEYLEHAEECDRLAALAKMAAIRQALQASAGMWRKLADAARSDDGVVMEPKRS